jgi:acyl-CoA thioesterase FadM
VKLGAGVARAQHVESRLDVTYPSTLRMETVFGRVGRTSLDMVHSFTRVSDEAVVARARITIVQLGPNGPSPIDPSVAALVTAAEAPEALPWTAPDDGAFETTIVVRPSDQDQFGHVNQARYVDFADDLRWFAARAGHAAGFEGALGRWSVDYRREVRVGTVLSARVGVKDGVRSVALTELESGLETTRIALAPRPRADVP